MGDIDVNFNGVSDIAVSLDETADVAVLFSEPADIAVNIPFSGLVLSPEYQAVYDSYTTKPDDDTAVIWNAFVQDGVDNGWWVKIDWMAVFAAHTNGAGEALKNWINPGTLDAIAFNAPAFLANFGFTGNGSNTYIDPGFVPSVSGVNYTLNSASIGCDISTDVDEVKEDMGALDSTPSTNSVGIDSRISNQAFFAINDATFSPAANTDSRGMYIVSRTAFNVRKSYKDKVELLDQSVNSIRIMDKSIYALARNSNGVAALFNTKQLSMIFIAGGFTQTNVNNMTDAYTTAINAL